MFRLKHESQTSCDICTLRFYAKDYLLSQWLDTMIPESTVKATIREVLASHKIYREKVNPIGKYAQVGWKMGWPHSFDLVLQFLEGMIYDGTYSAAIKATPK